MIHVERSRIIEGDRRDGVASPKAVASIPVYALQRPELVLARKALQLELEEQIRRVKEAIERVDGEADPARRAREDGILQREWTKLMGYASPDKPCSAMAKQIVERFKTAVGRL